jgi:transmembrane sensor
VKARNSPSIRDAMSLRPLGGWIPRMRRSPRPSDAPEDLLGRHADADSPVAPPEAYTTRSAPAQAITLSFVNDRETRAPRWHRVCRCTLLVAVLIGLTSLPDASRPAGVQSPDYETSRGEYLHATLSDGSELEVNTASQVQERFTPDRRVVILARGEALLRLNPRDARPFSLLVGDLALEAQDATVSVRRMLTGETQVFVSAGTVHVRGTSQSAATAILRSAEAGLVARYTVVLLSRRLSIQIAAPLPIKCGLAWRRREICLSNTPLEDAVAEVNRYSERELVISDSSLSSLRMGGVFRVADSAAFTRALRRLFGIVAIQATHNRLVLIRGCTVPPAGPSSLGPDMSPTDVDRSRCGQG